MKKVVCCIMFALLIVGKCNVLAAEPGTGAAKFGDQVILTPGVSYWETADQYGGGKFGLIGEDYQSESAKIAGFALLDADGDLKQAQVYYPDQVPMNESVPEFIRDSGISETVMVLLADDTHWLGWVDADVIQNTDRAALDLGRSDDEVVWNRDESYDYYLAPMSVAGLAQEIADLVSAGERVAVLADASGVAADFSAELFHGYKPQVNQAQMLMFVADQPVVLPDATSYFYYSRNVSGFTDLYAALNAVPAGITQVLLITDTHHNVSGSELSPWAVRENSPELTIFTMVERDKYAFGFLEDVDREFSRPIMRRLVTNY